MLSRQNINLEVGQKFPGNNQLAAADEKDDDFNLCSTEIIVRGTTHSIYMKQREIMRHVSFLLHV